MKSSKNLLDEKEVKHIAKLAKLDLNPEQISQFQKQLSDILDFVDQLAKLKTDNVVPTSQVTGLTNIYREDVAQPSLSQEEVLSNAPRKYKGHIVVDAIL